MGVDQQEFEAFEQLVLRTYFETSGPPLTAAFVAYAAGISQQRALRMLAQMLEAGSLSARATHTGVVEYFVAGTPRPVDAPVAFAHGPSPRSPHPEAALDNPVTAVCLSVLVPGAGHIYSGRPGAGVAWMASTLVGYACCFFPGLLLHGLCMLSAAHAPGSIRRG